MKFDPFLLSKTVALLVTCLSILCLEQTASAEPSGLSSVPYAEIHRRLDLMKTQAPDLVEVFTIQDDLQIMRIGKITHRPQPAILLIDGLHGDENTDIVLRMSEAFVGSSQKAGSLKNYLTEGGLIYVVPRVNSRDSRNNKSETDLNRHFFFFDSEDQYSSQTEVSELLKFIEREVKTYSLSLQVVFDYHCCDRALYYPWAIRNQDPPESDLRIFKDIGALFSARFGQGYKVTRIQARQNSRDRYPEQNIVGTAMDYFYSKFGSYAFTFEGDTGASSEILENHLHFFSDLFGYLPKLPLQPWSGVASHPLPYQKTEIVRDFLNHRKGVDTPISPPKNSININFSLECRQASDPYKQSAFYIRAHARSSEKLSIGLKPDHYRIFTQQMSNSDRKAVASGFLDFTGHESKNDRLRAVMRSPEFLSGLLIQTGRHFVGSMDVASPGEYSSPEYKLGDHFDGDAIFLIWGSTVASLAVVQLERGQCDFEVKEQFSFNIRDFKLLQSSIMVLDRTQLVRPTENTDMKRPKNELEVVNASRAFEFPCSGVSVSSTGYILTAKHCICPMLIEAGLSQEIVETNIKGVSGCQTQNQIPGRSISKGRLGHRDITAKIKGIEDVAPLVVALGKKAYMQRGQEPSFEETALLNSTDDDWALLKVQTSSPTSCISVARNSQSPPFADIWAIGAPGKAPTGSNEDRSLYIARGKSIDSRIALQTLAPDYLNSPRSILETENSRQIYSTLLITGGFSGSGLFNSQGKLIGINTEVLLAENSHLGAGSMRLDYIQNELVKLLGEKKVQEIFDCPN